MTTTAERRAVPRDRSAARVHLAVPATARAALAGVALGALLAYAVPLVAAVAAIVVAAVGIGLSEAGRRERAAVVLYGSLGMILPALAELIAQLVRLL
ncbi:MAG TPA: hypothetical protein VFE40_03005 [Jatrophihabitantaceae bacterium]|jgi:ABC-type Mn2+/Zn2+ transport system permease subunit|nr:hypothetical protein [Jatrophihabitantaceae bacterium]